MSLAVSIFHCVLFGLMPTVNQTSNQRTGYTAPAATTATAAVPPLTPAPSGAKTRQPDGQIVVLVL